jgi:ubiquinone/menaquinone biosynthesis C-methylase UbiE
MSDSPVNLWGDELHAIQYLDRADAIPHRMEGEAALLEWLPKRSARVLDLGSGDGRLLSIVTRACAPGELVALDFSKTMLERLQDRFASTPGIRIVSHDLDHPLPSDLGNFDAIVSSFAIHHLSDSRKRELYEEVYARLQPGGVFCNLEHVVSPTADLHQRFLAMLGVRPEDEDPSNKLLDVQTQLEWLREIGFVDVDCHWKWRELALLVGART